MTWYPNKIKVSSEKIALIITESKDLQTLEECFYSVTNTVKSLTYAGLISAKTGNTLLQVCKNSYIDKSLSFKTK